MTDERDWYMLDNAASIMPCTVSRNNSRVMRMSVELTEDVDPELLQRALDDTLVEFPVMRCCLRRGFFRYYLERTDEKPTVEEDTKSALLRIYKPGKKNPLLRVRYIGCYVNIEFFHALTDGVGAFTFIKHLVSTYLCLKYDFSLSENLSAGSSVAEAEADAFSHFYKSPTFKELRLRTKEARIEFKKKTGSAGKSATKNTAWYEKIFPERVYQLPKPGEEAQTLHLIGGSMNAEDFRLAAKERGLTIGIFATSLVLRSIVESMPRRNLNKKIAICVPVNLRNYFPSETVRNFFGVVYIKYDPMLYDGSLESISTSVQKGFQEELTTERVAAAMESYMKLDKFPPFRPVPLFLKHPGIKFFDYLMKFGSTCSVSNIGRIDFPDNLKPYVREVTSYMADDKPFVCVSTSGDRIAFGFTSQYKRHNICRHFFRSLVEMGIDTELNTNDFDQRDPERLKEANALKNPKPQECPRCKVMLRGQKKCCPLCEGIVTQGNSQSSFHPIKNEPPSRFTFGKLSALIMLLLQLSMIMVMVSQRTLVPWAELIMVIAFVGYLDINFIPKLRDNILKLITTQAYGGMIICFIVDKFYGFYGWSVIWVIPFTFIGLTLMTAIVGVAAGFKPTRIMRYFLFYTVTALIVESTFMTLGMNSLETPAYVSLAVVLSFFLSGVITCRREMKGIMIRLFHM